jgi:hypothetical protein
MVQLVLCGRKENRLMGMEFDYEEIRGGGGRNWFINLDKMLVSLKLPLSVSNVFVDCGHSLELIRFIFPTIPHMFPGLSNVTGVAHAEN